MKIFNLNFFKILAASLLLSFLSIQSEGFCGKHKMSRSEYEKWGTDTYERTTTCELKIAVMFYDVFYNNREVTNNDIKAVSGECDRRRVLCYELIDHAFNYTYGKIIEKMTGCIYSDVKLHFFDEFYFTTDKGSPFSKNFKRMKSLESRLASVFHKQIKIRELRNQK